MDKKGELTVFCGSMFAGKSTALLAAGERHQLAGREVMYIKPDIDTRYSADEIVTHNKLSVKAHIRNTEETILFAYAETGADVVLIDEVQFFDTELVNDCLYLMEKGVKVYCAGLDLDYNNTPFETVMRLMGHADSVQKVKAVCAGCGDDAHVTFKHSESNYRLEIGSKEIYTPFCRACYIINRR